MVRKMSSTMSRAVNDRKAGLEAIATANLYPSQQGCECRVGDHKARPDSILCYLLGASFGHHNIARLNHATLVYCNLMALGVSIDCEAHNCCVVEVIPIL